MSPSSKSSHFSQSRERILQSVFWLVAIVSLALGHLLITQLDVGIGDEDVHRFQINWFIESHYALFEHVTVLPLYHLLVAKLAQLTGLVDLQGLRWVHLALASTAVPAFYWLCRGLYPGQAASRTLQFLLLPLLFPLFFVTYTDVPALAAVMLMLERARRGSYLLAGLFALLAVGLRLPHVVWVGYAVGLVVIQAAAGSGQGLMASNNLWAGLRKARYLLLVIFAFLVFVAFNGGVAVGDVAQHPVSFNLSNLYVCLIVAWLIFLPFALAQLGEIRSLLASYPWIWGVLAGGFALYFYTYAHPHKYNTPELGFYIHNLLIHYTADFTVGRVLAFIPVAWMALAFATAVRASEYTAEMLLLVPFALLSFLPMPLIEPRYYLVALCLFIALRPPMSRAATVATFAYYIPASAWILYNISRQNFFL